MIIETASLLREVLRHDDELFRIGGDEFAAILEVQGPVQAVDIADRITAAARERGRTQVSVGIAVVDDDTKFIPLAERSDHIAAIGRWVLNEACRSYARWQEQGWAPEGLWVGINVSAAELGCGFVETVTSTLERFAVPADRFIIEVTEATFIDEQHAVSMLGQLRDLGINVAVDDFGTGYSSLSYLQRLEEDCQADVLRRLGQGFLWSRPVPEQRLPALAERLRQPVAP